MAALVVAGLFLLGAQSSFAADIALTPAGQSPDAMMVKVILKKMKVSADLNKMLKASDLSGEKVLIAVVGGSSKGLGAAGIDKDQEKSRLEDLLKAAKEKGIKVLVMHVGGKSRRGKLSDSFITCAVPSADKVIVVKGSNHDGIFDKNLASKDIEILSAENIRKTSVPLKKVLTDWGVIK